MKLLNFLALSLILVSGLFLTFAFGQRGGLTVVLENTIEDPLDPSMELMNGQVSAAFNAWAESKLRDTK